MATSNHNIPLAGRALMVVFVDVAAEHDDELNDWYENEHLPDRRNCPGFLSARRFLAPAGNTHKYLGLYDLVNAEVLNSDAYKAIKTTAWTERMRTLFSKPSIRTIYSETACERSMDETGLFVPSQRTNTRALWIEPANSDQAARRSISEHASTDGCLTARSFERIEGLGTSNIAIYDFESSAVAGSEIFAKDFQMLGSPAQVFKEIWPTRSDRR